MTEAGVRKTGRIDGVDVARAVAGIIMIQGHAYDGWCSPAAKATAAYAFTRLLGTLPLPAFLLLAGASVALRTEAACARGESARAVRAGVMRRGLGIVAWGYGVSAAFALMDGWNGVETFLRADVLHVIGLSIAAVAWLGIRPARRAAPDAPPDRRRLAQTSLALAVVVTIACPWVSRISSATTGPLRYIVALFADVPGVTLMPFVPLAAWLGVGVVAAQWMLRERSRTKDQSASGAPVHALIALFGIGLAAAVVGTWGTGAMVRAIGGTLSRAHDAVWLNVLDLAGRGLVVLSSGALFARVVRGRTRSVLLIFGRRSLVAYVFHIPFCYGAIARPFAGQFGMLEASVTLGVLLVLSFVAVLLVDVARRSRGEPAVPSPPPAAMADEPEQR